MFEYYVIRNFTNKSLYPDLVLRKESHIKLRADSYLISLSIIIFVAAMVLEGLLFLPITGSSLKVQIETFTAYIFTTSIGMLAIVGVSSLFKRKF